MNRTVALALTALTTTAYAIAPGPALLSVNQAKKVAKSVISADQCRNILTFIASDALLGRDTPSPGLDAAAEFLAYNLRKWGAKPGGDNGSFFQKVTLYRSQLDTNSAVIVGGTTTLRYGSQFVVSRGQGDLNGPAVFIDNEVGTTDVKGKIVFMAESVSLAEDRVAVDKGAVAVIRDQGATGADWTNFARSFNRPVGGFGLTAPNATAQAPRILMESTAFASIKSSPMVRLLVERKTETATTQNVVAIVEGSDPKLKSEYVALGAHLDHIGVRSTGDGDRIFNGADDDGSGTTAILAIAEAALTAKERAKRSLLFVWHFGEEKGLWGSSYFTNNPTVPITSIVAQLNIDMCGRSRMAGDTNPRNATLTDPNSIYVIGTTMMSTRLGELVHKTNADFLKVNYDPRYDDPKDPNRFYYRSDHYNYAQKGIPICFWFDGVHEDYHGVGDEVSKIDFNKIEKTAQTVFVTAVAVANEPVRPPVDKPLRP
ncbi:MAG: M28 family peptidase [Armatimonadetes bacterium]|nr:M28 family peptidase [Armatimonadota bacterium]